MPDDARAEKGDSGDSSNEELFSHAREVDTSQQPRRVPDDVQAAVDQFRTPFDVK
jgi:hypothetical protein